MKRVLLIAVIVIIVLVGAGAGWLYWFLSGDGIRRTLEQQATAWLGQPVHIASAHAQLFPRAGVELGDVRLGDPARITLQTVAISAPLRPLLSRRIEDAEITLAKSRIDLPLPFAIPTGSGGKSSGAGGDGGGGVQLVSIRAISLRDITITSRGRQVTASAESSLAGSRLNLERFTANSGRTSLEAKGVVELEPAVDANLTVNANRVDVDELLALASAFTSALPTPSAGTAARGAAREAPPPRANPAPAAPPHVVAKVTAVSAKSGDLEVQDFAATIDSKGDRVSLTPLSFRIFGGRYDGAITATLGRTIAATIRSKITDLDVAKLAAYGGAANTVSGHLSGNGTFSGEGADLAAALAKARGNGSAVMTNGAIQHLDLVRTVVLFLGRPAPDAGQASDKYDRIDLGFSLANQIAKADSFALRSPDFDLTGGGTLSLASKALDGRFNLVLSEKLSSQAGTDLVRYTREGNRVVLPTTVGGTLDQPRVLIDAKAALQRGIRNEGERRLKDLLGGLIK
jgi:uncharacterized protein involved in outer membrane biogenesis